MNYFYCQSEIEFRDKCLEQCSHCKEYYAPLEKEHNYFEEEEGAVMAYFNLDEFIEFSSRHSCEVIRGEDYQYELYIDGKGAYSNSLTFMGAVVEGLSAYKNNLK